MTWLLWSLGAIVLWGFWGVVVKHTLSLIDWRLLLTVSLAGYLGTPADEIFRDRFALFDISGADFPHDYRVAADGTVLAVERIYEGAFAR